MTPYITEMTANTTNMTPISRIWCQYHGVNPNITDITPISRIWCKSHGDNPNIMNMTTISRRWPPISWIWSQNHGDDLNITNVTTISQRWPQYHGDDIQCVCQLHDSDWLSDLNFCTQLQLLWRLQSSVKQFGFLQHTDENVSQS